LFKQEKIDPDYLLNLFMLTGHDYSILPHKAIFRLKPGHYFRLTPFGQEYKPYWFPGNIQTDKNLTSSQVIEELHQILTDAVRVRSDPKLKASGHLSGGLDSGIVATLARKEYPLQNDFYGFSWSPEMEVQPGKVDHDERLFVDKICRLNNIIPVYTNFDFTDYLAFLSDWRHRSELLTERKTVEAAAARGVNLIFSGWGGDEFISCAGRGIDPDLIRSFDWSYFLRKYPPRKFRKFFSALLFNALFPSAGSSFSKYKTSEELYCYIAKRAGNNLIPHNERFRYISRRNVHMQLLKRNHLAARAADWYVLGQRNGIEYRYPLLDKRIVEYMLKVPSRCMVDGDKNRIILRELGKGLLPEEVLNHKSKADPVLSYLFQSFVGSAKEQFINEFEIYRNNPDLDFVDFDLIRRNLPGILASDQKKNKNNDPSIFYYLKSAHEFTKGYYGA
jgi:asparagine synthase (glutamine-hydrolysing)